VPDTPVTAILDGIRERAAHADRVLTFKVPGNFGEAAARSQADVPLLLAAVEAALELAGRWSQDRFKGTSTIEWHHQQCAERLREAITAALGGKEGSEEEGARNG
jgi:hypothetical protein